MPFLRLLKVPCGLMPLFAWFLKRSVRVVKFQASARNKEPHTMCTAPGQVVYIDTLHCQSDVGITPASTHSNYLLLKDTFSRFSRLYSLTRLNANGVIQVVKSYAADHGFIKTAQFIDIDKHKGRCQRSVHLLRNYTILQGSWDGSLLGCAQETIPKSFC